MWKLQIWVSKFNFILIRRPGGCNEYMYVINTKVKIGILKLTSVYMLVLAPVYFYL